MYHLEGGNLAPAQHRLRRLGWFAALTLLSLSAPIPARAWGRKVRLERQYHTGQKMVYAAKLHTRVEIHSEPAALQNFLPPVPTNLAMQQQTTVTVKAVHKDGSADVETHFDKFEFHSDLADRLPANSRDPNVAAQQEISEHMVGQDIVAHYDREGKLQGFEGGEGLFDQFDPAYREPLRQALSFFLQQMGGDMIYPPHPVKRGETWQRKLTSQPTETYPYNVEGTNTLRFTGKTKVGGVRVAAVEFSFANVLTPAPDALGKASPPDQLESHLLGVDMRIDGKGEGRVLVAQDDGRVLQNHATVHQVLIARLNRSAQFPFSDAPGMKLEMNFDTEMDVEGVGR
jgi:hypothetical protein